MTMLINLLKRKSILVVVAFLLLISLVFIAGARYGLPLNTRLLLVLVLVFLAIFFLLLKQLRANKESSLIEASIKSQADHQKGSLRPDKREEIDELRRELLTAIESLKQSKLGQRRSGKAALYALPWYMIIGPPAAGKTTAILNSGLEFPYGSDIKGVGGTRNCDWFFSNSAIILDTAGRYVAEDEDHEEWLSFLDILKKYRRKRPINGVIIGMSVTDILKEDREGLEWHAGNIRRRIDELIRRLGICFPVYIVFTKCDLIQGFVESFETLNRKEREQIWGVTFGRHQPAPETVRDRIEGEWDLLMQALSDFRLKQLSGSPKPENRDKIYAFPLQFESLKSNLVFFIGRLFKPNPYEESPLFRGFYLTSGTQEGIPIDRVIQAIAKQFDLPSELVGETEIQKKTYFLKDVFTRIVIPDQNLAFHTSKAASQQSRLRFWTVVSSLVLLAAFSFGVLQGFIGNRVRLDAVRNAAGEIRNLVWSGPENVISSLKGLDRYSEELLKMESRVSQSRFWAFGMDRGEDVLNPAHRLYTGKAGPFIKSHFYQELADRLRRSRLDSGYPGERLYDELKAYMLLGSEVKRLDPTETAFLRQMLLTLLDEQYPRIFPQDKAEDHKPLAQRQIEQFVKSLNRIKSTDFENDMTLIAAVQAALHRVLNVADLYARMKRSAAAELPVSLKVSQMVAPQDREWISGEHDVPRLFTKQAWQDQVEKAIAKEVENVYQADWVLGRAQSELASELQDPKRLTDELRRLYFREYAETWWQFLRSIRYAPFPNLETAAHNLKRASSRVDSPLMLLLEQVAVQTDFEGRDIGGPAAAVSAAAAKGLPAATTPADARDHVNREFRRFREMVMGREGQGSPEISTALAQFSVIGETIEAMKSSPGQKAGDYAAAVLSEGQGTLPEAFLSIRRLLDETVFDRDARKAVFEQLLDNVWAAILRETQDHLNLRWKERVHQVFFEKLGRSYPFQRDGGDASLPEFKIFFESDGTLWKFLDLELGPFVHKDSWIPRTWQGGGVEISEDLRRLIDNASIFRRELFPKGEFRVRFQILPNDPPYRWVSGSSRIIEQIILAVDGESYPYRMGGTFWKNFEWPVQASQAGAALTAFPRNGPVLSRRFEGEWGWPRLLGAAKIEEIGARVFRLTWLIGEDHHDPVAVMYLLRIDTPLELFRNPRTYFDIRIPETLN